MLTCALLSNKRKQKIQFYLSEWHSKGTLICTEGFKENETSLQRKAMKVLSASGRQNCQVSCFCWYTLLTSLISSLNHSSLLSTVYRSLASLITNKKTLRPMTLQRTVIHTCILLFQCFTSLKLHRAPDEDVQLLCTVSPFWHLTPQTGLRLFW